MIQFKSIYVYSLIDFRQADLVLSVFKELIQNQSDENSLLQNKLDTKSVENNGMLLYCLIIFVS